MPSLLTQLKLITILTECFNVCVFQKLLWAVAEALRAEGISMSHKSFRPCAGMLGCLVRSHLPDLNSKREGSTSELMLKLSKKHVKDIIQKYQSMGSNKVFKS